MAPGWGICGRMEGFRNGLSQRRVRYALAAVGGLVVLVGIVAWRVGLEFSDLKAAWTVTEKYLQDHPSFLFWAIVFLPGLPVPTTALFLMAGVVWRQQPLMACLLCLLGLTLNLVWTYALAAGPARRLVEKLLVATEIRIPELPRTHHLRWILVLKLTPGIPLFLQNYLLGFLRAPFKWYLGISILCNGIVGTGTVLGGAGLADGKWMPAVTGAFLIVLAVVLARTFRRNGAEPMAEK